jgi:hypothetical protein
MMPQNDDAMTCSGHTEAHDHVLPLRPVFGGLLFGTLSNIAIIASCYSIWIGLLCHSVFGAMGMVVVLALSVF